MGSVVQAAMAQAKLGSNFACVNRRSLELAERIIEISPACDQVRFSERFAERIGGTVMDGLKRDVWPHMESGAIKPVVEAVIPMQDAEQAHALVAGNDTVGKVVLQLAR